MLSMLRSCRSPDALALACTAHEDFTQLLRSACRGGAVTVAADGMRPRDAAMLPEVGAWDMVLVLGK